MIKVSLRGVLPAQVRAALERAGVLFAEPGDIIALWFDGRDRKDEGIDIEHLDALGNHLEPVVAFVARPDLVEIALRAGALEAFGALPSPPELRARLESLARYSESWRAKSRAHLRRAHRLAEDLDANRALLDGLLLACPQPVMVADFRGRILRMNPGAETVLGYTAAEAAAHLHVTDIYANPGDARRVLAEIRGATSGVAEILDVSLRARSGEQIPIELHAGELHDPQGEPVATFGVFTDLRERNSLRLRLEQTSERLIAVEKRSAVVAVASSTAHELNQPLTAVMGSLEILELRHDLPDDVRNRLQRSYTQLERMVRLIRDLGQVTSKQSVEYLGAQHIPDPSDTPSVSSRTSSTPSR